MAQALGSSVLLDNTRFRQHLNRAIRQRFSDALANFHMVKNHVRSARVFTVAGETSPRPSQGDKFMSIEGFAQKVANLIRFLCGALRIFAASALKWPLNAETQRLDGGPQRRFIPKTPSLCKASIERCQLTLVTVVLMCVGVVGLTPRASATSTDDVLNEQLVSLLSQHGFTGRVGLSLEQKLGRKIDNQLADLGRLAFHDSLLGLNDDNSCSGCHSAPFGFGDSQSI